MDPLYDCEEGRQSWDTSWPDSKKDWCCREQNIACREAIKGNPRTDAER
jgi:hypothetical protein